MTLALTGVIFLSGCGTNSVGSQQMSALIDIEETFEVTGVGVVVDIVSTSDVRTLPQATMDGADRSRPERRSGRCLCVRRFGVRGALPRASAMLLLIRSCNIQ